MSAHPPDPPSARPAWHLGVDGAHGEPAPLEGEGYAGDMVLLLRQLEPTEAHVLCGLLRASGIQAMAGDTELVQTHSLWSIALGGANVRVPATQLAEAQAIHAAYLRGEFELSAEDEPREDWRDDPDPTL